MPFFAHPFDVYAWYAYNCIDIVQNGPFARVYFAPPLWWYTMIPLAYFYHWLSMVLHVQAIPVDSLPDELNPGWGIKYIPGMLFNSIIKIPLIVSDFAVAVLMYKMAEELTRKENLAERAAALWFLNPFLIWISAGWGMFDTLPTLFTVASLLFLIRKRVKASATCLAISASYKLYAVLFLIPVFLFLFRMYKPNWQWKWLSFVSTFIVACILIDAPRLWFFRRFLLFDVLGYLTDFYAPSPFFGLFGFGLTYWSISLLIPLRGMLPTILMGVLATIFVMLTFITIGKSKFNKSYFDLAAAKLACVITIYLSYSFIGEQYFVWALPFFVIVCIESRVKNWLYTASSIIALAYAQKNFPMYLLPTYPLIGDTLVQLVRLVKPFSQTLQVQGWVIRMPSFTGALILTFLGLSFSIIMLLLYFKLILGLDWKFTEFLKENLIASEN
jgi:Gpi18-like mannosyltransferase